MQPQELIADSMAETFNVSPVRSRPVLAPRVPAVTALAAARREPGRRKKLKWRTRDSQASLLYNLELDVMGLRQEIQRLMEYHQVLDARTLNRRDDLDGYYVKAVKEYHRVFENGYDPTATLDAMQFVKQVMDENLVIGRFAGREVLLHQWEQCRKAFVDPEFRYLHSHVLSTDEQTIVTSFASYKHVVTKDTLELLFPHAMRDYPQIVSRMLGRGFNGVYQFDFTFDIQTHCVVSIDWHNDFLQVFLHLLQDPHDLCAIFQGARISEECLIGDVSCYEECSGGQVRVTRDETTEPEEKREPRFTHEDKDISPGLDSGVDEHSLPSLTRG